MYGRRRMRRSGSVVRDWRSVTGMAAVGIVSGLISQALFSPASLPLQWLTGGEAGTCSGPASLAQTLAPGFAFALALAPLVVARAGAVANVWRTAVFIAAGAGAWYAAYRLFLLLADWTDELPIPENLHMAAIGMAAGLTGTLLLCAAAHYAFSRTQPLPTWPLILAGTAAGAGVVVYDLCGPGGFEFFALWQGAVAGSAAFSSARRTRFSTA